MLMDNLPLFLIVAIALIGIFVTDLIETTIDTFNKGKSNSNKECDEDGTDGSSE